MQKRALCVTIIAAALALPAPALANIYIPSFVQIVTAPLPWSLYLITCIITIPVMLAVAFIESLVVRRYVKGIRLLTLIRKLLVVNLFSSIIGLFVMPSGTEIWPGIPIAYAATTFVEAIAISFISQINLGKPVDYIKFSARMNAYSYACLTVVIAGFIFIPSFQHDSTELRRQVTGQLIVADNDNLRLVDIKKSSSKIIKDRDLQLLKWTSPTYVRGKGSSLIAVTRDNRIFRLKETSKGWKVEAGSVPADIQKIYAISPDSQIVCCQRMEEERLVECVYDLGAKKTLYDFPEDNVIDNAGSFSPDNRYLIVRAKDEDASILLDLATHQTRKLEKVYAPAFHPSKPLLAWSHGTKMTVYDCSTGKRRSFKVPGTKTLDYRLPGSLAWTPDGEMLTYIGSINPYTFQRWSPDIRVITADGKRSTTIHHKLLTTGRLCQLIWMR